MIFSITDKIACYYNNEKEKKELIDMFKGCEYKVFTDMDRNNALMYANLYKISGFKTNEMNAFDIFTDLKEEGIQVASFKLKNQHTDNFDEKVIVLNPVHYITSDRRLTYSSRCERLTCMTFSGSPTVSVKNFYAQVYEYAKAISEPVERAAYLYFENHKKEFGKYPWKTLKESFFTAYSDKASARYTHLKIETFGSRVQEMFSSVEEEYRCGLKDEQKWSTVMLSNICDIKESPVSIAINDKNILAVIDEY